MLDIGLRQNPPIRSSRQETYTENWTGLVGSRCSEVGLGFMLCASAGRGGGRSLGVYSLHDAFDLSFAILPLAHILAFVGVSPHYICTIFRSPHAFVAFSYSLV